MKNWKSELTAILDRYLTHYPSASGSKIAGEAARWWLENDAPVPMDVLDKFFIGYLIKRGIKP